MLPKGFTYTDKDECGKLVRELAGLKVSPSDLEGLLEVSAGTAVGESKPVCRPYFLAALILDGQLNQKRVRELKGIKFDNPSDTVAGLLRRQRILDVALELTVPEGMSAVAVSSEVAIVTNRRRGW